jgi:hypothetical protein
VPHDHLLLREPSRVVFFTTTSTEQVWPFLQTISPDANLSHVWDIVELLRYALSVYILLDNLHSRFQIRYGADPSFWQRKDRIEEAKKIPVFYRRLLCLSLAHAKRQEESETSDYYVS